MLADSPGIHLLLVRCVTLATPTVVVLFSLYKHVARNDTQNSARKSPQERNPLTGPAVAVSGDAVVFCEITMSPTCFFFLRPLYSSVEGIKLLPVILWPILPSRMKALSFSEMPETTCTTTASRTRGRTKSDTLQSNVMCLASCTTGGSSSQ